MQPMELTNLDLRKATKVTVILNNTETQNVITWERYANKYGVPTFRHNGIARYDSTILESIEGVTLNYLGTAQVLIDDTWFYIEREVLEYND